MKKLGLFALVACVAFAATACVAPYGAPNYGGLVTMNVKGPVAVGDNSVGMSKMGVAESQGIIFVSMGDASIKTAMENGGITKVHHVDCEAFSVLGIYSTYKTVVYGE